MKKNDLIGLSEDDAKKLSNHNGMKIRVIERDGESFVSTLEFRPDRYNVSIKDGKVTYVGIG